MSELTDLQQARIKFLQRQNNQRSNYLIVLLFLCAIWLAYSLHEAPNWVKSVLVAYLLIDIFKSEVREFKSTECEIDALKGNVRQATKSACSEPPDLPV